jgi:(4S)-4-hydroxy-5-phosphonooxypentane-2,3-dione isomerase
MYMIVVSFEIKPEHRQDFIKAALQDGQDSSLNEPGTRRIELIQDESKPNRFYLSEAYEDKAAFEAHANGPYFQAYFAAVSGYSAQESTWLVRGTLISSD